jgi:hypothetical protein
MARRRLVSSRLATRSVLSAVTATVLIGADSCGKSATDPTKVVASVQITVTPTNPRLGQTALVSATPVNSGGLPVAGVACIYGSSAPVVGIAVPSGADAVFTGLTVGSTTITARCGGKTNSVVLTVRPPSVTLTLAVVGSGNGALFADPPGLSYDAGTTVAVTETPIGGSVFTT